jgi:APA family basic amino acid/polyamine antiporter
MAESSDGLRRELGLLDATMINVGTMVASAIFIVPSAIAAGFLSSAPSILVWVIGGLVSMAGALCMAELGAAMPDAGGQYVYLQRAYSPVIGFLYGWGAFLVINTASIAAIAVGFATYLGFFIPLSPTGVKVAATGSIVILTLINCLGLRVGAVTQNVLTVLKMGSLAAIVLLGLLLSGGSMANFAPLWPADGAVSVAVRIGPALVAVLWAYDGWIESTYVGSEIKRPERNLPLSIVLSVVIVTALYVLVVGAYTYLLSPTTMAASTLVASDAMKVVIGAGGAAFVAAAIIVATLGANNGIVFTSARIPYAMARQGLFFSWAAKLHPIFRSPVITLLVQGGVAVALTLTGSYVQLSTYVVFVSFLFYALSAAAVIVLRYRAPTLARPYRAWGYPLTPLLFIAFAMYLVIDTIVQTPRDSAVGAGILVAGLPAYWYWKKAGRGPAALSDA